MQKNLKWRHRTIRILAAVLTCALLCGMGGVMSAIAVEGDVVTPDYYVDFSQQHNVESGFTSGNNVSAVYVDKAAKIEFLDVAGGYCDDPYITVKVPSSQIDCEKYPYFALIVKTNKNDIRGELRFRTTETGPYFPCQEIRYKSSEDWQLVVCKLTDLKTVYYSQNTTPYTGAYTEIRLDMFDNTQGNTSASTEYYIKAVAFYKTAEDAKSFLEFTNGGTVDKEEEKPNVNYSDFWRGEEFYNPANNKRMNFLSYGFSGSTSPVDQYLGEGYGGIVSNVRFNKNYLKDPNEFSILKNVYDYAAGKNMELWIYDEYQWPSGKAYGLVLDAQKGREWEATGVEHIQITGNGGTASYKLGDKNGTDIEIKIMQAVLTQKSDSKDLDTNNGKSVSCSVSGKWTLDVYVLRYTYNEVEDRNDFNTLRDVDLLDPDAVKYFIEITHGQYKKYLGESFENITAFFTDEPQLGNRAMNSYAVWTDGFAESFFEEYGYNINLPSLYSGSSDFDRMVRVNYYQLVAKMFKESYIDQISKWCEENGVASSGHLLFEEDMNDHIETYGGSFMQVVGGMTIPGVDVLWVDPYNLLRSNNIGNYMGIRYVSSAAKNSGKTDVMIEYNPNATGSLNSSKDMMGESIGGLTISRLLGTNIYNVINPQRDYSTSQLNTLNTYIGRINTILDGAVESGQLAVFYPIATVQAYHDADRDHSSSSGRDTTAVDINEDYEKLCLSLLQNQYLYTIIDDESICSAKINGDGRMVIGDGCYSTVIIPYTEYMSVEALKKLAKFEDAGGVVLFYNISPTHGLKSGEEPEISSIMEGFDSETIYSYSSLIRKLKESVLTNITLNAASEIPESLLMGDFETESKDITFFVNTSDAPIEIKWRYTDSYKGKTTMYYPGSGNIEDADMSVGSVSVTIPAYEGVLVVRDDENDLSHGIDDENTVPDDDGDDDCLIPDSNTPGEVTTSDTDGDASGKKKGCRSFVGTYCVSILAILGGAVIVKRRKEDQI